MPRVLIISHTYAVPARRRKIELLAQSGQSQIGLVYPAKWEVGFDRSENQLSKSWKISRSDTPMYQSFPLSTFFTGDFNRYFFEPLSLFLVFLRFRPHLAQIEQEPWSFSLFQGTILAKLFRAKVIFFTWENIYKEWQRLFGFFEKTSLHLADAAVIGNSEAGEVLRKKGFQKPIVLVPQTGVDPNFYKRQTSLLSLGGLETAPLSQTTVGFVGRFDEAKGVWDLLDAFEGLQTSLDFQLLLAGDGPLKNQIFERISKNEWEDLVKIVENVPMEEMTQYYSVMDILVVPSKQSGNFWKEQFGRVIIEAMSCEVAVLGSSSGAIPEVIGEAGLIFKENDIIDLSDKLKRLISDLSLREQLAKAGRQRVLENYKNEIIAQKTLDFWKEVERGRTR